MNLRIGVEDLLFESGGFIPRPARGRQVAVRSHAARPSNARSCDVTPAA
jgi:hypothetical protein